MSSRSARSLAVRPPGSRWRSRRCACRPPTPPTPWAPRIGRSRGRRCSLSCMTVSPGVVARVVGRVSVDHPDLATRGPGPLLVPARGGDRSARRHRRWQCRGRLGGGRPAGDDVGDEPTMPVGGAGRAARVRRRRSWASRFTRDVADGDRCAGRWCAAMLVDDDAAALGPSSRPAARARADSGTTPAAMMTRSAGSVSPLLSVTVSGSTAVAATPVDDADTGSPRAGAGPARPSQGRAAAAHARRARRRSGRSPRWMRFSASSSPMKPPPMMTAVVGACGSLRRARMASSVGEVAQRVGGARRRGSAGAWGPRRSPARGRRTPPRGLRPEVRSRTVTTRRSRSTATTSWPVRTSMLNRARQGGRGLQEQGVTVLDDAAHVVGEAAVGERHVVAALEDDDVHGLVEATQAGGRGHARGHSAHDDGAVDAGAHRRKNEPKSIDGAAVVWHSQRSSAANCAMTMSTCWPQPDQVTLLHEWQRTGLHMGLLLWFSVALTVVDLDTLGGIAPQG